jgi:UDP-glucose:(heptosyl)LPS alpha-1,3-glucosyltransferase
MPKPNLNIAVIVKSFVSTGGAEKYAVEVTRRLIARGHNIDLFAWRADETQLDGIDYYPVPLPTRLCFTSVLTSVSFARQVARLLDNRSYDVIFSHERGYCQDLATIHTFSYWLGTEAYSFLKKLNSIYLSPRSGMHLWLERKQMESTWLAPVSSVIKRGIETYYDRTAKVTIATPGVDIDWFNPTWIDAHREGARNAENIKPDELAVLFVGTEFKRKGLDDLIRAIGPGMKLLVVGQGERLGYYRNLAEKCGVLEKVLFKGLTDNVRDYYAAADVVVLPSLKEAFGMSILEAMACGLPVVSSSTTGVAALIEEGKNGYIFHNPGEMGVILKRLKAPALRLSLGRQARLTAERHTWEDTAAIYENICLKIADEKKGLASGPFS